MKLVLIVLAIAPLQLFAIADLQFTQGGQQMSYESSPDTAPYLYKLAAHVNPLMEMPVGFGFQATHLSDSEITSDGTRQLSGFLYGPEVTAWLPLPLVTPFASLGLIRGSQRRKTDMQTTDLEGRPQSMHEDMIFESEGHSVEVGLKWKPASYISLIISYRQSEELLTPVRVNAHRGSEPMLKEDIVSTTSKGVQKVSGTLFGLEIAI